jgi:surfeit locus 1 family protein
MRAGYTFHPKAWSIALAATGCLAGIALGNWQTDRAAQKRAAGASFEEITLRGEFDPTHTVFLDNKVYRGKPGYQVVQPLRTAGGKHVLVNRGWLPAGASRDLLPAVRTPAGTIALSGLRLQRFAQAYVPPGFDPAAKPEGKVWQNVTREQFSAWSGMALEDYVMEQHSALDDGLARDWPAAEFGAEKSEAYALQWYALAGLSVVLFFVLNVRRAKH